MIKDENYYTVCGWMLNRLHLTGNDLIVYALIYSFSQDGESEFKGSLSYIQGFTGLSKRTIQNILDRLVVSGYIKKQERNSVSGTPNSYMVVPRASLDGGQVGVAKNATPPRKNNVPPMQEMPSPVAKNATNKDSDNDNDITGDNERKKEKKKNKQSSCAQTRAVTDFESMSDEQLLEWGERGSVNWEDPADVADFYGYCNECKRRGAGQKWQGKIVKGNGVFERLRSHEEVMTDCGVSPRLRDALRRFLRHCYANGHLILNDTLEDIIFRLQEWHDWKTDEEAERDKIASLEAAINGGYYDVKEFRK